MATTKSKAVKLKPKIKAQWIAALRSGKYEQGNAYLRAGDKFCCLGVLCDLARVPLKKKWSHEEGSCVRSFDDESMYLPNSVRMWAGLPIDPDLAPDDGRPKAKEEQLTVLNDAGKSFKAIATWIEKNL